MELLVSPEWLAQSLGDDNLRILDCTVFLRPTDSGAAYRVETGLAQWEQGHIPNSGFLDQVALLSDPESDLNFTALDPAGLAAGFGAAGIGADTRVVLYDRAFNMWATRVWWLLRSIGFDNAAVLDGGWKAWTAEGFEVSVDPDPGPAPGLAAIVPDHRPGLVVDRDEVSAAISDDKVCLINALSPEIHNGDDARYGKPGHIASSVNVYAVQLVDPKTHRYKPLSELGSMFADAGVEPGRIVTWCGGGIAATSDAFVLTLLGYDDIGIYDGSLSDWISAGYSLSNPSEAKS